MTNLADLLPAGGGQNNTDFVADGNISSGAPVILTAAGKAAAITGSGGSVGTSAVFESATSNHMAATYDSANNKIVICYRDDGNSYYGTAVVATVSGDSISFGTPAVFSSSSTMRIAPVFDTYRNRVVIIYKNDGDGSKPYGITGAVSGTSISFGSANVISANSCDSVSACFDSVNNQTIFSYMRASTSGQTGAATVDVSGNIGYGSTAGFVSNDCSYTQTVFDPDTGKAVVFFTDAGDSYKGKARVITNSSGTITFGTVATMDSSAFFLNTGVDYDTSADKMVIAFADQNNSNYGYALVGTVSGTDITFGTLTQFVAANMSAGSGEGVPVIYDPDTNKSIVAFKNATAGDIGQFTELTVSGTSVTGGSLTTFQSGSGVTYVSGAYDANANKTVLAYTNKANSNYGTGVVITPNTSTLTSTNLLGIASGAISDTATGTINTWGSRNEAAVPALATGSTTDLTGKTQSPYPVLTYDTTHSKFVAFFQDANNSNYGTAVVITVSGSTVSFGTPVVFESAATYAPDAVYNAAADQHMVVYPDYGNSQQATAVVGSVSGTSITFGTPAIYDTGTANVNASVGYNATLGKYLAAATPTSYAADDLKIYVLSVSGTTITAGSGVTVGSGKRYPNIVANDSASDFVLTNNTGNNQAEAHLISVSGTTPTVEDTEAITSVVSSSFPYTGLVFLESNKFVCVTNDATNDNMYTRTITVSGTSLSIGTQSSAFTVDRDGQTTINGAWPLFFVSATEAYLYYQDDTSDYLKYIPITISGTTATGGTEVTYHSTAVAYTGFLYNSSSKQSVSFFQDSSQTKGLAQNGALVIGTDYYVQADGTLSTDTGGQLIGQAITTTQINIKDYTG